MMNTRTRLLWLCLLLTMGMCYTFAQDSKGEEYMQELMEEGLRSQKNRAPDAWIHCDVKKNITYEEWQKTKNRLQKRFVFGRKSFKEHSGKLTSFEFIPARAMYEMVYTRWNPYDTPFSELKNTGIIWVYTGGDLVNRNPTILEQGDMKTREDLFHQIEDAKWSGDVVNGLIEGDGVGLVCLDNNRSQWLCFKGTFHKGFPVGTQINRFYSTRDDDDARWAPIIDITFTLSPFDNERGAVLTDAKGKDLALIDHMGMGHLMPEDNERHAEQEAVYMMQLFYDTKEDFSKMERSQLEEMEKWYILRQSPYDHHYWVDRLPSKRFVGMSFETAWTEMLNKEYSAIINSGNSNYFTSVVRGGTGFFSPGLITMSRNATTWRSGAQRMTDEKQPGGEELLLMMNVGDGLYLTSDDMVNLYRGMLHTRQVIPLVPSVYSLLVNSNYWDVLSRALESVDKLKELRPDLKAKLETHKNTLNNWMDKSLELARQAEGWQRDQNKNDAEELAAYKANMCEKCRIDGSKTTFPEGYVDKWEFLFMTAKPAQSQKDGRIVLVNGETITWKYIYHDDGTSEIKTEGAYRGEYGSVDEMMDDIVKKCKNRYCN